MKTLIRESIEHKNKTAYLFLARYAVSTFLVFFFAFVLLKFPACSAEGVKNGIEICLSSLIPGLYPFMILTNAYACSKAATVKVPFADKVCRALFKLPGSAAAVIFFSLIGGLPIGAKMSAELYERGELSREQFARMLCFCVNPGPAFVISVVGMSAFGSEKTGVLIYISLVISSLLIGFISRFFSCENESYISTCAFSQSQTTKESLLSSAVKKSSRSVFVVCSWVVAFSCIGELFSNLNLSDGLKSLLLCTAEMTKGSFVAAENYPVPITAAVIGFSGICGHFQLMGELAKAGMRYKYFLVGRIINSAFSAVICALLLKLFPVVSETFSVGIKPEETEGSGSVMLSFLMIVMAVLFVLGDDYRISRKKVRKI